MRGSSKGSYYQAGKTWAKKNLSDLDKKNKSNLCDLFIRYKSLDCERTKKGIYLTPSKRQFYYGAANQLKEDLK
jgi:hypothetical protein